jgi:putative tryptophan/tyrosine transport system substrate-binding protein
MRRRVFIALLGGAAVACPLAARAQQPALPVIGYLYAGAPEASVNLVAAFRKGLSETGYVEGQNVAIEFRWAQYEYNRLPALAADLVRRRVDVIATPAGLQAAFAAKATTTTIPIVFSTAADPVQAGLVASLNRPGGNLTGISHMNIELSAKRLGLLHELLPGAVRFAVLVNPNNLTTESVITEVQAAAKGIGRQIEVLTAGTSREIDAAFAKLADKRAHALMVSPDTLFVDRRVQLVTLAVRLAMPTVFPVREFTEAGGLMSYGSSFLDQFHQAGIYTGRVLKGEKAANLPILRATRFELVINLQTARALAIEVPPGVLSIADEVID